MRAKKKLDTSLLEQVRLPKAYRASHSSATRGHPSSGLRAPRAAAGNKRALRREAPRCPTHPTPGRVAVHGARGSALRRSGSAELCFPIENQRCFPLLRSTVFRIVSSLALGVGLAIAEASSKRSFPVATCAVLLWIRFFSMKGFANYVMHCIGLPFFCSYVVFDVKADTVSVSKSVPELINVRARAMFMMRVVGCFRRSMRCPCFELTFFFFFKEKRSSPVVYFSTGVPRDQDEKLCW